MNYNSSTAECSCKKMLKCPVTQKMGRTSKYNKSIFNLWCKIEKHENVFTLKKKQNLWEARWGMPVIPTLRRLRQRIVSLRPGEFE
jgi:hypothetical protein